jgi:glutathione S-transferase
MKLYTGRGPNPKMVRMFMAEKGFECPKVEVDLLAGENRREPYLGRNPAGQLPCLELDDGTCLAEITAICEYVDEVGRGPSLIGATPAERGVTRMWTRRIDLNICENLANGFRFSDGLQLFQSRIHTIPQAAADLKQIAQERLKWLDGLVAGRQFICGDKLTMADILLFAFLEFGARVGQKLDPGLGTLPGWYARMAERPSAKA